MASVSSGTFGIFGVEDVGVGPLWRSKSNCRWRREDSDASISSRNAAIMAAVTLARCWDAMRSRSRNSTVMLRISRSL